MPHLPGCGRMLRGSLPSARGPAQSHACQSPAFGPPAAQWETVSASLGLLPTPLSRLPQAPNPGPPPSHVPLPEFWGVSTPGPQRASPRFMLRACEYVDVFLCICGCFRVTVHVYLCECADVCLHGSVCTCDSVCVSMGVCGRVTPCMSPWECVDV